MTDGSLFFLGMAAGSLLTGFLTSLIGAVLWDVQFRRRQQP